MEELLTGNTWQIYLVTTDPAIDVNGDGQPESTILPLDCTLDDFLIFNDNHTWSFDHNIPCDIQFELSGYWSLSNDGHEINGLQQPFFSPSANGSYSIVLLNKDKFWISYPFYDSNSNKHTIIEMVFVPN